MTKCTSTGGLSERQDELGEKVDGNVADINAKLDTALLAKQESEAKATSLESKVQQYELEISQLKEKVTIRDLHFTVFSSGTLENCYLNVKNLPFF